MIVGNALEGTVELGWTWVRCIRGLEYSVLIVAGGSHCCIYRTVFQLISIYVYICIYVRICVYICIYVCI